MNLTPIVYVHGVAVRDDRSERDMDAGSEIFDHLLQDVSWSGIEAKLKKLVASAISPNPEQVSVCQAYWGDLGARLSWGGASYQSKDNATHQISHKSLASLFRAQIAANIRPPLDHVIALFMGDVFCYLSNRGDIDAPGAIPLRVMQHLKDAQSIADKTGEPLVVLSNSMGCEIVYDLVTYFLPNIEEFQHVKIDYWCGVASQIGLFEELKLFKASSDRYGIGKGNKVPFPDKKHLGHWWNVWDPDDVLSYSVRDIIEGADDGKYVVGKSLFHEHLGYLQEDRFYETLADWIKSKT